MKCPNCKKDIVIPTKAYLNLETYNVGGSVLVATNCCNFGVNIKKKISYEITPYIGNKIEDDWGNKIIKNDKRTIYTNKKI